MALQSIEKRTEMKNGLTTTGAFFIHETVWRSRAAYLDDITTDTSSHTEQGFHHTVHAAT